jgi:hypothetical protein
VRRRWRQCSVGGLLTAVTLASAALATPAVAKQFRVHTCSDADLRALIPTLWDTTRVSGWGSSSSGLAPVSVSDRCSTSGPFRVGVFRGRMTAGETFSARWTPARGTALSAVSSIWQAWSDTNPSRGDGTVQLTAATDQQVLFSQNVTAAASVKFGYFNYPAFAPPVRPAQWFEVRFTCLDQCATPSGDLAVFEVLSARFDVDDSSSPVGGLSGGATDAQVWSGVVRFGLNAADGGGGLYRAVVEVDGADALSLAMSDPGGYCRDIGPSSAINEFAAAQPCPLRIDGGALDVDSAKLPQGRHSVRVLLEDAAGNRTAIFGPVVRSIAATGAIGPGSDPALRGAANGDGASDQARLTAHWGKRGSRTRLVSEFGHRHVVRGRLTAADGAPIANAAIDVVSKTTAVNARELAKRGGPRTENDGRWRMLLPRGVSSRELTFRYRSHVNDTIAVAQAAVHLRVRAGLRLAIRPRVARRGQAIRFAGRLLGGPLPRGGKQIVLVARASRGGWVRFNVVRTDGAGEFRTTYRFQQPGPASYRFRALSLAEAAYPYSAGGSNVVVIRKLN